MYNLFLEDGDLLENVEITQAINEEKKFVAYMGMIDKDKLNDKEYIKSLVNYLDQIQISNENVNKFYKVVYNVASVLMVFTAPPQISIPAAALTFAWTRLCLKWMEYTTETSPIKGVKNLTKAIDNSIKSLEKAKSEETDNKKKKQIDQEINKLKKRKEELIKVAEEKEAELKKK